MADSSDSVREWKHFTIAELKERKCARLTADERTHETMWMGQYLRDGSVSSSSQSAAAT